MQLPDLQGPELAQKVLQQYPKIKIIILSSQDVIIQVKKMLRIGCMGYLLKDADDSVIAEAIDTVYKGGRYLSPRLNHELIEDSFKGNRKQQNVLLSRREKEVLKLIVDEYTNQEIADQLFLSMHTVENHRISLLHKLNVKNTAGLVRVALENGLL
jgi:DNA-binding NarL/FixJ family response regulator